MIEENPTVHTNADRPRHQVLTGPGPENRHWLRAIVRAHFNTGGYRDAWAVTTTPNLFLNEGLVVTTNPDIAAAGGAAHWVSSDLTGVLIAVGNEITARRDTTPGAERAGEPSRMLLALDEPALDDGDTATLRAILDTGPAVGITVVIATSQLPALPGPLIEYLYEKADVIHLPEPGTTWSTDEHGGIRLGDLYLDLSIVAGLAETMAADLAAPPPAGHSLLLGPTEAATVVLRMRSNLYPEHTSRWLAISPTAIWPSNVHLGWRSTVPEDVYAMWAGARQAIDSTDDIDLVIISVDPFTGLDPDRTSVLDDLLYALDNGPARGVRLMLSAPDRDHVPARVLAWFDQNPERGTVIMVEDHGTR